MTEWRCTVLDPDGVRDQRVIIAPSADAVVLQLSREGLTPISLRSGPVTLRERLGQPVELGRGANSGEQALLLSQLATLINASMPIEQSLDLVREQASRPVIRLWLADALSRLRDGAGLAEALRCRDILPDWVTGVIAAAERSGSLPTALTDLAERMKLVDKSRRDVATALTYPAAILVTTILALALILLIVIPQFEPLFAGQEGLPATTEVVLWLSALVRAQPALLLLSILAAIGLVFWIRSLGRRGRLPSRLYESRLFRLRDRYLAGRSCAIFGQLLKGGITVADAIPLVRDGLSSVRWRRYFEQLERDVRGGETLSDAMRMGQLMPDTVVQLVRVGEGSGNLASALDRAGQIMTEAATARIARLVSLVSPIAIVIMGAIVAFLVGGVMLGIFALGDIAG